MTPFEVYKMYRALNLHFTSEDYDYFKYKGKVAGTEKSFDKRNDKFYFQRLAKKEISIPSFLLANLHKQNYYIIDLLNKEECQKNFDNWRAFRKAFSYNLKQDFAKFKDSKELVNGYRNDLINIETIALLCSHSGKLLSDINESMTEDILWKHELQLRLEKYIPFVPKQEKYSTLALDKLKEMNYIQ